MADQDVAAQVRAMRSVRDFDRLKAAGTFEDMTPEVVEALGGVLSPHLSSVWRRSRAFSLLLFLIFLCLVLTAAEAPGMSRINPRTVGLIMVLVVGILSMADFGRRSAVSSLHRRAVDVLLASEDVRVVGALTGALNGDVDLGSAMRVRAKMPALLVRVGPVERDLLSPEHRSRLLRGMTAGAAAYNVAVIEAFARIGDWTCLPQAALLAEGATTLRSGADAQRRAAELVPLLEAIRDRERTEAKLLRPAEAPADATLLRPASGGPIGDEAVLLRSADEPAQEVEAHS